MHCNTGRDARIALRAVEKAGVDIVSFNAPRHKFDQRVVESTAHSRREGGIRSKAVRSGVRNTDLDLGERPEFSHGKRDPRSEQDIQDVCTGIDRTNPRAAEHWKIEGTVVSVEISDEDRK